MASIDTNWAQVKQAMIDDVAKFSNEFSKLAIKDIEQRIVEKGVDKSKLEVSGNRLVYVTDNDQQYNQGLVYFEEVIESIKNTKNWPDLII